jgi:hypothetical protein
MASAVYVDHAKTASAPANQSNEENNTSGVENGPAVASTPHQPANVWNQRQQQQQVANQARSPHVSINNSSGNGVDGKSKPAVKVDPVRHHTSVAVNGGSQPAPAGKLAKNSPSSVSASNGRLVSASQSSHSSRHHSPLPTPQQPSPASRLPPSVEDVESWPEVGKAPAVSTTKQNAPSSRINDEKEEDQDVKNDGASSHIKKSMSIFFEYVVCLFFHLPPFYFLLHGCLRLDVCICSRDEQEGFVLNCKYIFLLFLFGPTAIAHVLPLFLRRADKMDTVTTRSMAGTQRASSSISFSNSLTLAFTFTKQLAVCNSKTGYPSKSWNSLGTLNTYKSYTLAGTE